MFVNFIFNVDSWPSLAAGVIRLKCIYNFLFFHAIILEFYICLILIYNIFMEQPINLEPSVNSCFLLVFGFAENQYLWRSKYVADLTRFFGQQETLEDSGDVERD